MSSRDQCTCVEELRALNDAYRALLTTVTVEILHGEIEVVLLVAKLVGKDGVTLAKLLEGV